MQDNNSNFLMAVFLSLGVLLGWQFFVVEPRLAEERARQLAAAEEIAAFAENQGTGASLESELRAPDISGAPTLVGTAPAPSLKLANNDAFTDSPRLKIETEQLSGSIALMGARFDDLILADYAESLAADAPRQRILRAE
ncbi:MAG: membrane protein insertase YidC, partial [Pseudomonadota bacterium]|nr:membrane protein insertase YidC [Pseudomonadota bacterium]